MKRSSYRHAWRVRYPLGTVDAYRAMGTVAAPLLAGFTLSSIVLLLTAADGSAMPLYDWGITGFAIAVLFVFSMQFTYCGLLYAASPSERMAWLPHYVGQDPDESAHAAAAKVQIQDQALQYRFFSRAGLLYNFGILGYTAGLALILIPRTWTAARAIALVVLGAAFVLETIWIVSTSTRWRPMWLLPGYGWARQLTGNAASTDSTEPTMESMPNRPESDT
jgi:hypothetical protein